MSRARIRVKVRVGRVFRQGLGVFVLFLLHRDDFKTRQDKTKLSHKTRQDKTKQKDKPVTI